LSRGGQRTGGHLVLIALLAPAKMRHQHHRRANRDGRVSWAEIPAGSAIVITADWPWCPFHRRVVAGRRSRWQMLVFSQVVLSFQLPFAMWPLIKFSNLTAP
jgi:hypothetical protein